MTRGTWLGKSSPKKCNAFSKTADLHSGTARQRNSWGSSPSIEQRLWTARCSSSKGGASGANVSDLFRFAEKKAEKQTLFRPASCRREVRRKGVGAPLYGVVPHRLRKKVSEPFTVPKFSSHFAFTIMPPMPAYESMTVADLKELAEKRGIKEPGVVWSDCCPPEGLKGDIIKALKKHGGRGGMSLAPAAAPQKC